MFARSFSPILSSVSSAWQSRTAGTWLAVLLSIDAAIIVLHLSHAASKHYGLLSLFDADVFSIQHEGGLAELFEYGKAMLAATVFLLLYKKGRNTIFALLAVVYVLHVLDNSLRLHEQAGAAMQPGLSAVTGLGTEYAQALGELLAFGSAGLLIAIAAAAALIRVKPTLRHAALAAVLLLGVIAVFGMGVDAVHAAVSRWYHAEILAVLVEDGGELVVLSWATAHAIALAFPSQDQMRAAANPPVAAA